MKQVNWRLDELLSEHGVTPYRLMVHNADKDDLRLTRRTIYNMSNGNSRQISLETLTKVLVALEDLTGKTFSVCDLLEYK